MTSKVFLSTEIIKERASHVCEEKKIKTPQKTPQKKSSALDGQVLPVPLGFFASLPIN